MSKALCCTEFDTTAAALVVVVAEVGVKVSVMVVEVLGARWKIPDPLRPNGVRGILTAPFRSRAVPVFVTSKVAEEALPITVAGNTMVVGLKTICAPP